MRPWTFLMCAVLLMLAGCAADQQVVFTTVTEFAIDMDAHTQSVQVGYSRHEGVIAPAYENGAIPPVYGAIDANLRWIKPEVRQVYATGAAAQLLTDTTPEKPEPLPLSGAKKAMFFGTSTIFGLKAGFSGSGPDSVTVGYKRKEASVIPVDFDSETGDDVYGSVIASVDMSAGASTLVDTGVTLRQFFASGSAAENLATNDDFRNEFTRTVNSVTFSRYPDSDCSKELKKRNDADPEFINRVAAWLKKQPDGKDVPAASLWRTDAYPELCNKAVEKVQ